MSYIYGKFCFWCFFAFPSRTFWWSHKTNMNILHHIHVNFLMMCNNFYIKRAFLSVENNFLLIEKVQQFLYLIRFLFQIADGKCSDSKEFSIQGFFPAKNIFFSSLVIWDMNTVFVCIRSLFKVENYSVGKGKFLFKPTEQRISCHIMFSSRFISKYLWMNITFSENLRNVYIQTLTKDHENWKKNLWR